MKSRKNAIVECPKQQSAFFEIAGRYLAAITTFGHIIPKKLPFAM